MLAQSKELQLKVFYTWQQLKEEEKYDHGFGKNIEWDIPLLEGYDYIFVKNTSGNPGTNHFRGIINPSLNDEIVAWQPNAILIFGWNFFSHLKCIRYFHKKVPVIFRGDSTLLDENWGVRKLFRRIFLRWVYSSVDYALYVGKNNKDYFIKHGLNEKQLISSPHAIDNDRFAQPDEEYYKQAQMERLQLGIKENDLVLIFAGKLEEKKNPFFLLEIAHRLKNIQIKFLFIGNGSLEKALKISAANDSRIIFKDFVNQKQMPVAYRLGDVFILPSTGPGETWGLSANEAMASGLAVMLSNKAGSSNELVKEEYNGIIFSQNDIKKCVDFLTLLLQDRQLLLRMKQSSTKLIQQFTYHNIILSIEEIISMAVK